MSKKQAYLIYGFVMVLQAIPLYFYFNSPLYRIGIEYPALDLLFGIILIGYFLLCLKLGFIIFCRDKKD